ncbi:MAG: UDP-2,3-diacylglucosamine diphosphatase LpxI [Pseudomonadota bacterium]
MTSASGRPPLAIFAGGGDLPLKLAEACKAQSRDYLVFGIEGSANKSVEAHPHHWVSMGQVGHILKLMKRAKSEEVVFAGYVKRPDFSTVKVDFTGAKLLPKIIASLPKGDDALLKTLVDYFDSQGFRVVGAETVFSDLLADRGVMGAHRPVEEDLADINRAVDVIRALGPFDVGQAALVVSNAVLAVEGAEGTDAMLDRCSLFDPQKLGTRQARRGVLVKIPKPEQERRVDLPTIGVRTISKAGAAGMRGIAIAAGGALILDREAVVEAADAEGLFLVGIDEKAAGS